jgi:cystathionine gamma-synthase
VVGYEEGNPAITSVLKCGYPRFVYHPYVLQLMQAALDRHGRPMEDCLLLPSIHAGRRCQAFLQDALEKNDRVSTTMTAPVETDSRIRLVDLGVANVHAVMFPAQTLAGMEAKAYWQHTGDLVSSRRAEQALTELGVPVGGHVTEPYTCYSPACAGTNVIATSSDQPESPYDLLRQRIAEWAQVPPDHVFLTPSGMSTIYKALRSARRYNQQTRTPSPNRSGSNQGGTSIVFGFPYLDTLKLCSRTEFCPDGVEFFGHGDQRDLDILERLLAQRQQTSSWCVLFTEVPSNPLLQCPDLEKLRALADQYNFCLAVDDTIGNFLNVDLLQSGLADVVCTSLTKLVSGRGDAMAGSVIFNPNTPKGRWMQEDMLRNNDDDQSGGLFETDAWAILRNSQDFVQRNAKINVTAEALTDWLHQHPDVETVYYPKLIAPFFSKVQRQQNGGYGGLFSMVLAPHMCQRTFYDALNVAKGPSLGTNFTLACPYTLLAHYHELDFAMSYNVPPNLIRVAVGLDDAEVLKSKFDQALSHSRLYPKFTKPPPRRHAAAVSAPSPAALSSQGQPTSPQRRLFSTTAVSWSNTCINSSRAESASSAVPLLQQTLKRALLCRAKVPFW